MSEIETKLCKIMQVTKFSDKQKQFIKKWSEDWNLTLKDIVEAYDITLCNLGKIHWSYWDLLLRSKFIES